VFCEFIKRRKRRRAAERRTGESMAMEKRFAFRECAEELS
jgi:hypothetical protein